MTSRIGSACCEEFLENLEGCNDSDKTGILKLDSDKIATVYFHYKPSTEDKQVPLANLRDEGWDDFNIAAAHPNTEYSSSYGVDIRILPRLKGPKVSLQSSHEKSHIIDEEPSTSSHIRFITEREIKKPDSTHNSCRRIRTVAQNVFLVGSLTPVTVLDLFTSLNIFKKFFPFNPILGEVLGITSWISRAVVFNTLCYRAGYEYLEHAFPFPKKHRVAHGLKCLGAFGMGVAAETPFASVIYQFSGANPVWCWVEVLLGAVYNAESYRIIFQANPRESLYQVYPSLCHFWSNRPNLPVASEALAWRALQRQFIKEVDYRIVSCVKKGKPFQGINPCDVDQTYHRLKGVVRKLFEDSSFEPREESSYWIQALIYGGTALFALTETDYVVRQTLKVMRDIIASLIDPDRDTNSTLAYDSNVTMDTVSPTASSDQLSSFAESLAFFISMLFSFTIVFKLVCMHEYLSRDLSPSDRLDSSDDRKGVKTFLKSTSLGFGIIANAVKQYSHWNIQKDIPVSFKVLGQVCAYFCNVFLCARLVEKSLMEPLLKSFQKKYGTERDKERIGNGEIRDALIKALTGLSINEFKDMVRGIQVPEPFWPSLFRTLPPELRERFQSDSSGAELRDIFPFLKDNSLEVDVI